MRMFLEPDDVETYEAVKELLTRRAGAWAREQGAVLDPFLVSVAMDFRNQSADGRLGRWTTALVQEFLLDWMPRYISAPATEVVTAPEALRTLMRYLADVELDDPMSDPLPQLETAITDASGQFQTAMSDQRDFGPAKFWAMTAIAAGVDASDNAAMRQFMFDLQNGRVEYDTEVLDEIMRRSVRPVEPAVQLPQLPVFLPPEDELADQANASKVVQQLRKFVEWLGTGRPLTGTGQVKLADARELVELLDTGDVMDTVIGDRTWRTSSSTELRNLSLLVEWAKKARLVRVVKDRLVPIAKAKPLLRDGLALWQRAFDTIPELGDVLFYRRHGFSGMFGEIVDEALPDILNSVYGMPELMPVIRLQEPAWLMCLENFRVDGSEHEMWRGSVYRDVQETLEALADLGAVELTTGIADPIFSLDLSPAPGAEPDPYSAEGMPADSRARIRVALEAGDTQLVRLTALGTYAVREQLLAQGRSAPLVGELSSATAAQLLGTIAEHYDRDGGRAEIDQWLAKNDASLDQLLDAVRRCQFRSRAAAMLHVLLVSQPDGNDLVQRLRTDRVLGPIAIQYLIDTGRLDRDDLSPSEGLAGMTEQFLQHLEIGGAEAARATLASAPNLTELAYAIENSGHPDTAGLAEFRTLVIEPALKANRRGLYAVPRGAYQPKPKRPKNKRKR